MNQIVFTLFTSLVLVAALIGHVSGQKRGEKEDKDDIPDDEKWMVTKTVFFDISIDMNEPKRVTIALFGDAAPNTVNNFAALSKGNYRGDPKFGFKGTKFHKIVKDFVIQGGDITTEDGSGGKSIYGPSFNDEPFYHSHVGTGYLSMANRGPDTNGSQFFILLQRARWLDGKHVVFGKIIEGMEHILEVAELETTENGQMPKKLVTIEDSGLIRHDPYVLPEDQR
ncbi:peptidyl-prolyl cis-trans isomerase A-like [Symsagittifera roscoffensis]|uniref:peptidyl-prolyl cis-trans isomerase A-like n=1 Tax=Symsagittifera roscoffensis TaxID=84072 RepID=UPI00307CB9A4